MTRLTDTQLLVLSKASQRADHAVILPETLNRVTAGKVVASLMKRQLLAEAQADPGMPVWRIDHAGIRFALIITEAGLQVLGVAEDVGAADNNPIPEVMSDSQDATAPVTEDADAPAAADDVSGLPTSVTEDAEGPAPAQDASGQRKPPRPDTKLGAVLALLQRPDGATLHELVQATEWLPHTTRAALTGLRKRGYIVDTVRERGRPTVYRIGVSADGVVSDISAEQR